MYSIISWEDPNAMVRTPVLPQGGIKILQMAGFIILKLCTIQASIPVEIKFTVTDLSKLDKEKKDFSNLLLYKKYLISVYRA